MSQIMLPPHQAWTFARLPDVLVAHDISPVWVLHVGAHHGEEVAIYRQCGFGHITLVEPDPRNIDVLVDRFGADPTITFHHAAVADHAGTAHLHYAERTVWSGLTPHPTANGSTVMVDTVQLPVIQRDANVLVIDTQGSELEVLRTADLARLDLAIIETSRRLHDTAAPYDETKVYMAACGWRLVEEWVHDSSGYTDCVYIPCD